MISQSGKVSMDNNGDSETLTIDLSFFGLPKQVKEKMTIYLEGKKISACHPVSTYLKQLTTHAIYC